MMERTKRSCPMFQKGDQVWLEAKNLKLPHSKKITTKREGPFKISEVLGPVNYRLNLPERWKIHDVFHASLLSPYTETEVHGTGTLNPPPDLVDGEEEYEIEAIIAHRTCGRGYQYLVRWKGYLSGSDSWLSGSAFNNAKEILNEYKLRKGL